MAPSPASPAGPPRHQAATAHGAATVGGLGVADHLEDQGMGSSGYRLAPNVGPLKVQQNGRAEVHQ